MGAGEQIPSISWRCLRNTDTVQEGWLAENAVSEEDRLAAERAKSGAEERPDDPMQGLEGLDVAGPRPE